MAKQTVPANVTPQQLAAALRLLPDVLAGRRPDPKGYQKAFLTRIGLAWLEKVKLAYIVKARGGTDDAGIQWPPLSKKYLAYGRGPASSRKVGGLAPGGKDGALTPAQLKRWRQLYGRNLARFLAAGESQGEAQNHAAAVAWTVVKREGGKTKLEILGNRPHEILRDTGVLLASLSPGQVNPPILATYAPPVAEQEWQLRPGSLAVGTNVPYARSHHEGSKRTPKRPLWPDGANLPQTWTDHLGQAAKTGIAKIVALLAKGHGI